MLDMRGRAPGRIREFSYRERTFFVDDISYTLLTRGLEKTKGVFTYGLYEAIVNGPHTHRARDGQARGTTSKFPLMEVCHIGKHGEHEDGHGTGHDRPDEIHDAEHLEVV